MHFTELPTLGVGIAADIAGVTPDYRTFIGHGSDGINYLNFGAHYVQGRRVRHFLSDLVASQFPLIFHPINFNVALEDSEDVAMLRGILDIIEFTRPMWVGQDVGVWSYGSQYLGPFLIPPILDSASVQEVVRKVKWLNDVLPCPFLVENPPIAFSVGDMHLADFMREIAERADCGLVLDIGHLIGYQQARREPLNAIPYTRFPFDRIVEVHVAGLQFSRIGDDVNIIDQHAFPVHESCWTFLDEYMDQMTQLKAITLEQEYCEDSVVRSHLVRAKQIVRQHKAVGYET